MITEKDGVFTLETRRTTYCFRALESGHLEHLYYGRRIHVNPEVQSEKHTFPPGNTVLYSGEYPQFSPEDLCQEISGRGKGDIREPFLELVHNDGSRTTDFRYEWAKITKGKQELVTLPSAYGTEEEAEQLHIFLKETAYDIELELCYSVFADCDVITRSARLVNRGTEAVRLDRLMSLQLDFDEADYQLTTFNGAWTREMEKHRVRLSAGAHFNAASTGTSSSRANPFVMLSRESTTEDAGEVYGFNLIYSGNHCEITEVSTLGKLRLLTGINPDFFEYWVEPGEVFETPEAVMTYSSEGFSAMSFHMHTFIRNHIVRGKWKHRVRPVLLNSWEAAYFDISERKLLRLAREAKAVGVELFVMDDGWFKGRDDDTSSLGDWECDRKKLPGGLRGIADKVRTLGLEFGIWVEPEMVSVNSDLYRAHPDWVLEIPGSPHSEGRNQRILDLTRQDVQDYVIQAMSQIFSSAAISYVKWDMNRNFSDYFSQSLAADRQGEVAHRYICGLYRCMRKLTKRFPDILFEGCASGGNRFDLGILCYFPQIWASDNTDAYCRAVMQTGYSYGYPQEVLGAHVSDVPNHQTLRSTPLAARFHTAAFANLGYECNLCDMGKEEKERIRQQILLYKKWRETLQTGRFYRIRDFTSGNLTEWCIVSEDQKSAVGYSMRSLAEAGKQYQCFRMKGLLPEKIYHFYNQPSSVTIKDFGGLVNTAAPIHIRPGSVVQDIASRFVKMSGEMEDYAVYGDTLMYAGVKLKQGFSATGYDETVRLARDFESRLYFVESQ